jgi:hypothetical protein
VTVKRIESVTMAGMEKLVADPSLLRAPTETLEPSEKVRVAPLTWSFRLGRS